MKQKIQVVLLDIDDTLLDFGACSWEAMEQAYRDIGIALTQEHYDIFVTVNHGLWQALEQGRMTKDELFACRWNEVFKVQQIQADGVNFEVRFQTYLAESALPVSGARELLSYLSKRYIVCVASNAPYERQIKRLKKAGMMELVDHAFISGKIGYSKPSKEFFDACFRELPGILPHQAVIVGDSLSADISGGVALGMQTVWFNRDGKARAGKLQPDYIITDLKELQNIL